MHYGVQKLLGEWNFGTARVILILTKVGIIVSVYAVEIIVLRKIFLILFAFYKLLSKDKVLHVIPEDRLWFILNLLWWHLKKLDSRTDFKIELGDLKNILIKSQLEFLRTSIPIFELRCEESRRSGDVLCFVSRNKTLRFFFQLNWGF